MRFSILAAMDARGVIGKEGGLPWPRKVAKPDLQLFRERTMGHTLLMGRKTWESLPGALEGRLNVVVSNSMDSQSVADDGNAIVMPSIDLALRSFTVGHGKFREYDREELFIIGGASVYEQTIDRADRMYLTQFEEQVDGDTHFPSTPHKILATGRWVLSECRRYKPDDPGSWPFNVYILDRP